ncbi:MAG: hypothetical protein ACI3WR_05140 [Oscillospiraceae bacterium]
MKQAHLAGGKKIRLAALAAALLLMAGAAGEAVLAATGLNVTQNWEAAAVYYSTPCDETETFRMTEEEFCELKVGLEEQLVVAYSAYLQTLSGEARQALQTAQKCWIDCYYAYIDMLRQAWDAPVKVDFNVAGKERRTNIYRDVVLVMLSNRIEDLTSWREGRFAGLEAAAAEEKSAELEEALTQLQVDMGLCLYVTTEDYRAKMMTAHRAFYRSYDADQALLRTLLGEEDGTTLTAEGLLQTQRMSYITQLHYQGCRFFHTEREE